jgi:hypothetical protein
MWQQQRILARLAVGEGGFALPKKNSNFQKKI